MNSELAENVVLIVGAGPTGLTMAIELKRLGLPCRIIDKSTHAAQWSQALVVQARTLEVWERYRISEAAVAGGRKLKSASFISEGEVVFQLPFERIPARYPFVLFYPQNETERLLTEHLESLGGAIERGVELASFENSASGVVAELIHPEGRKEESKARWMVACDGAHSVVRERLKVPFEGESVQLSFFLGDLELEGPDALGDELRIYLHGGDVVFIGRLRENVCRVIVALHSSQPEEGKQNEQEFGIADFQAAFDRAGIKLTVKSSEWITPFHVNDRQAAHMRVQSAFLAGDASHIHSPVGGQGMNTGIQDAVNLAWKLKAAADGAPDRLLDTYEEERAPVGKALLRGTSSALKMATSANPLVEAVRDTFVAFAAKIPQVQDAILEFISETAIEYRNSSIVTNLSYAGKLRAGDRMPNVEISRSDGARGWILDPLRESKHLIIGVNVLDEEALRNKFSGAAFSFLRTDGASASDNAEVISLLGYEGAILAIRPDGYVGFRGGLGDFGKLREYAALVSGSEGFGGAVGDG